MRVEFLPDPRGLYVLTKDGRLGVYDGQKRYHLDAGLTAALFEHNTRLLKSYLPEDEVESSRIGFIYPTRKPRPWGPATMFLEDNVVRRLYPTDAMNAPLTAFQKKNQEKSIYRGLELLLEYRSKEARSRFYCPVLFDRGRMLNQYLHCLGRAEEQEDAATPVIEVINLIAGLSLAERNTPTMRVLEEKLYASIVCKDKRRPVEFAILDAGMLISDDMSDFYREPHARHISNAADDNLEKLSSRQEFEAPGAADKQPVWRDIEPQPAFTLSAGAIEKLYAKPSFKPVDRWLEVPHRPVAPAELRRFTHFCELDAKSLGLLAAKTFIYTAPARARLLECGTTDHWNIYLLQGALILTAEDGQKLTIEGGSAKAATPIAFLKPRKYTVSAATSVRFLCLPDAVLRAIGTPTTRSPGFDPPRSRTATERKPARDLPSLTETFIRLLKTPKSSMRTYSELDTDSHPSA